MFIISFGFLFLFTAFQSLQNLQSSLNKDEGLGLASLSVIYGGLILSCILVLPFVIGRLGCKWTLVLSMIGYVLYTVSNYYARWGTLIPASIIIGEQKETTWIAQTRKLVRNIFPKMFLRRHCISCGSKFFLKYSGIVESRFYSSQQFFRWTDNEKAF